jgi:hypothetical protein
MQTWPRFLPDLTTWYPWHSQRGTLPAQWKHSDIGGICRALGAPGWEPVKPWRVELAGIEVRDVRGETERVLEWITPRGTLVSRWTVGPDGDWWQSEYPVKSAGDIAAALLVAQAREYVGPTVPPAPARGEQEMRVIELPQRPWSELFHSFLGWSEGLMIFLEEPDRLQEIATLLETKLAALELSIASAPADIVLCPDNLDAQFISPPDFEAHLAPSYERAAAVMHEQGKRLVVHVGGPIRRLLPGLAASGVDCVEGICGPPQGDASLAEARADSGAMVTWGGLAQDYLLATRSEEEFLGAAREAVRQAAADERAILGVADRVPVEAIPERLATLAEMARSAGAV